MKAHIDLGIYFKRLHSSDHDIIRALLAPYMDIGFGADLINFIMDFTPRSLEFYNIRLIEHLTEIVFSQKESTLLGGGKVSVYSDDAAMLKNDSFLMKDADSRKLHDQLKYLRLSLQDFQEKRLKFESELDQLFDTAHIKAYIKDSSRFNLIKEYFVSQNSEVQEYEDAQVRLLYAKNLNNIKDIKFDTYNMKYEVINSMMQKTEFEKMDLKLLSFDQYLLQTSLAKA